MTLPATVVVGALVLVVGLVWVLVPPFPAPGTLMDRPLSALTKQLGPPRELMPQGPSPLRLGKSVAWEKSRGIAFWTLQADWTEEPVDPLRTPDMVSRCLRLKWAPEWLGVVLFLPCEAVGRARVMASNNRWRGP